MMLQIDGNSSYLELKEFLEDIYIYLNNQIGNKNDENDSGDEHRVVIDLLNRCKLMLNIFEKKFEPNLDQSYLDMNGSSKLVIDQPCEYVDVTSPADALIEANPRTLETTSDEQNHIELRRIEVETNVECPFSGLPAAHLLIKKSPKIGYLQRIKERTSIFNQSRKKYYSGLLEGWLLMYSNNCDLKPSICLNLQNYDLCNSDSHRKREQFQLISNECRTDYSRSPKKYLLQATSTNDYEEWLLAITTSTKSSLTRIRSNSTTRKLPSPPSMSLTTVASMLQRVSDRSEDIYEEPSQMFSTQLYPSFQFDNWTQLPIAPTLPVKYGLKSNNEPNAESVAYDVPKSPPKPALSHPDYLNKIQQVKTQLSMQLLVPKQMTNLAMKVEEEKPKAKKKSKVIESVEVPKFTKRNWFLNRLSGKNGTNGGGLKMEIIDDNEANTAVMTAPNEGQRLDGKRGGKINMIINQLEANGHFPLRKMKQCDSRYSKYSITAGDNDECHTYEPVVVSARMK